MGLLCSERLDGAVQTLREMVRLGVQPLQREQHLAHARVTGSLDLVLIGQYVVKLRDALTLSPHQVDTPL